MSRWRRQQRKRAGQRRWLEKRFAEFQERIAEAVRAELRTMIPLPLPESQVLSPRDMLVKLRASLETYVRNEPQLGPSELVKLEDIYR